MTKYVLECPECATRFELLKYAPERRTRCRKCKSVIVIPYAPGDEPPKVEPRELSPELRRKVVSALSLRKLALVSGLLCLALAGAGYILVRKRLEPPAAEAPKKVDDGPMTLEKVVRKAPSLALPLRSGGIWEYALQDGRTERRHVTSASEGLAGGPEYVMGIAGPGGPVTQTIRIMNDGAYLVGEVRGGGRATFRPPLKLAPTPLYYDDRWTHEGEVLREGAAPGAVKLEFFCSRPEGVETRLKRFTCLRVEVKGIREGQAVDEVLWYSLGTGLIKRQTRLPGGVVEEATLSRVSP